jgi:hypothetical protein
MIIKWVKGSSYLTADTLKIDCWCDVRTVANGRRKRHEVVYSIPGKQPYDPVTFPKGKWMVERPEKRTVPYLAPWFIPTTAWCEVSTYGADKIGYTIPTGYTTIDRGYGLHYSTSGTTLGCIRIAKESDLLLLVELINKTLDAGELVTLEVV